ncbi:unnamed protein product [Nippostrongylus brasiliensis]|uniref:Lateral signaling target protein 2 (inferred by orthology to a C. elegans protein) n=1 Tax=Nippostrongylus brasiliensis TaxID=27835 RepID=A0A0N4Y0J9_NIPBR|nr:unnamed protein product [Nippostrongylus brasiliensis]
MFTTLSSTKFQFQMLSLRKLMNKPRPDDWAPLAKFFYADEALNTIALELDSFDGRRDPERCNALVNKLRISQDRVLHIIGEMLMIVFPRESDRACRDFRVKFPDEIIHDSLPGQLWFGAECLAAGSSIIDHESESDAIRPLAKELTRHLDSLRDLLKDQSLRDPLIYTDAIKESLLKFDHLFAAFEFQYVSAMVPVKSVKEHDAQLDVAVLFSDVLQRALAQHLINQEQIDSFDPIVMICIPRLAIVWGLIYYPEGALNVEKILCTGESQIKDEKDALTMEAFRNTADMNDGNARKPLSNAHWKNSAADDGACCIDSSSDMMKENNLMEASVSTSNDQENEERLSSNAYQLRSKFQSPDDLIHRLFVCISGVADQLQTNYSSEVRKVLKLILQPTEVIPVYERIFPGVRWVPDEDCDQCTACSAVFTVVRRRHHCRNCGRIFCQRCSRNAICIPELGYERRVSRVEIYEKYRFFVSVLEHDTRLSEISIS